MKELKKSSLADIIAKNLKLNETGVSGIDAAAEDIYALIEELQRKVIKSEIEIELMEKKKELSLMVKFEETTSPTTKQRVENTMFEIKRLKGRLNKVLA